MGAMADAIVAYAQPLIDQTDGSPEELEKALALTTFCYNLALLPDDTRDTTLNDLRSDLKMGDEEFDAFRRQMIDPMIRRHEAMFPRMHQRVSAAPEQIIPTLREQPSTAARAEAYPGTDRYAPCPCNSGQKYKFCCGMKRR